MINLIRSGFYRIRPVIFSNSCCILLLPPHSVAQSSPNRRVHSSNSRPSIHILPRQLNKHRYRSYSVMTNDNKYQTLEKLGLLQKENIHIKNKEKTESILQEIVDGGFQKLQVVADFDYTLTCMYDAEGKKCYSSWGVLDNSPLMPDFYRDESFALLSKYYPIEISVTIPEKEKIPLMVEWYTKVNALLARCKVSKHSLDTMVSEGNCKLRQRTEELLHTLNGADVPVLVFSAGMGDILMRLLNKFNVNAPNVKVVSNFFKYDENECVAGFNGEMIHMFNKNENAIHSSPYFEELKRRSSVILMGDSLGDTKMALGVPSPNNILKIGFLNEKIEERLPHYEDAYDIVLLNDQTMDVAIAVCDLLK